MNFILYKATSPSGRIYIGVTNNFKRRMKEHLSSKFPFGHALRKYGRENFTYEFEYFETMKDALAREGELITVEEVRSKKFYNSSVGGNTLAGDNPMHNPEILENHPNLWTSEHNPMNNPDSKQRMIESQNRKAVSIEGVEYPGVRHAGRMIGQSRQMIVHRLKSDRYPDWYYI